MKKATILFLFIFLIGNSSLVMAEPIQPSEKTKISVTNPDIFIKTVTPFVNDVVKKEHGEKATWTSEKVTHLSINNDHTVKPPKSWYEMKMNIRVRIPEKNEAHLDTVILRIDSKTYHGNSLNKNVELDDASIKLLNYIHNVKQ